MAKPKPLSDAQIKRALPGLHGWRLSRGALRCEYKFESFKKALQFLVKVAGLAEAANHHPDIDIRYCVVRLALRTHDVGAVSDRDLSLARVIDGQSAARKSVR
jgi:4a-hydroxytetrahydrobiopterin dehydratase